MHPVRSFGAATAALLLAAAISHPAQAREMVGFNEAYSSGTIVVKTAERNICYLLGNGHFIRYPVGVGRAGKQWRGTARIDGKHPSPSWGPRAEIRRDKPSLPAVIPG